MSLQPVSFKKGRQALPRLSEPYVAGRRDKRFWTDAEIATVRKYYPAGGTVACLAHLGAHRTPSSIYGLANKLGLKAPLGTASDKTTQKRARIEAPANFDDLVREFYQSGNGKKRGECNAFADNLGVPRWWVTKRAIALGLAMPHKKEPPWTAAEKALMAKVPLHNPDRCAEIFREHGFNRSPTAIMVQAKRIGISRRFTEGLSARAAAKIIGIDDKGITAYCISGDLKASKRDDNRLPQQGGSRWVIKPADLREFVIDNLGRIDFRKVEKFGLVRLLTTEGGSRGPDRSGWTVAEDNIVKGGYARRLTITKLIDELEASGFKRRSAAGISGRAKFLGCLSSRASEEWLEREDEILRGAYAAEIRIADIVGMLEAEGFKRTRGAIQMRAIVLRISTDRVNYWTEEETRIALDGLRAGKPHREVLQDLRDAGFHRGDTAIFKFAKKHNILRHREPPWTDAEYELLRQRYDEKVAVKEIAAELGRKLQAVRSKASNLGLKQRTAWTPEEYEQLRAASERGDSLTDAATSLGRPYVNVARQAAVLKLSFKSNRPTTERTPT
ncbi:hypothetical protein [Mesorhizobium sp.]|uniref:hypothetical protein n=1 Tax=Mesorhizobium sp. TaxID=1871066 RepID=UPI00257B6745|nr:hypothetical protein [Mesorhizobium sp.]